MWIMISSHKNLILKKINAIKIIKLQITFSYKKINYMIINHFKILDYKIIKYKIKNNKNLDLIKQ